MQVFDLKAFRKENNFTQTDAAQLFGCKQSYISDIERYRRPMPEAYIERLIERNGEADVNRFYKEYNPPTVNIEQANVGNVTQGNNKHKGDIHVTGDQSAEYKTKLDHALAENERLKGELTKAKDFIIQLQQKIIDITLK